MRALKSFLVSGSVGSVGMNNTGEGFLLEVCPAQGVSQAMYKHFIMVGRLVNTSPLHCLLYYIDIILECLYIAMYSFYPFLFYPGLVVAPVCAD